MIIIIIFLIIIINNYKIRISDNLEKSHWHNSIKLDDPNLHLGVVVVVVVDVVVVFVIVFNDNKNNIINF